MIPTSNPPPQILGYFFKGERGWVGLGRFKNERCSVLVQLSARENDVTRNDCFLKRLKNSPRQTTVDKRKLTCFSATVQNELLSKKISCLITDHIILRGSRRRELNSFKSYITVCEMSTTRPSIVRCSSKLDRSKRLFSAPDA